ncbi:uncharacterized protein LOC144094571 [Amblyomma americanum]
MTANKLPLLSLLRAAFTVLAFSAVEASYTKAFYERTQRQPLMTYLCYRSGVTIEPEDSVNLAALWDGTKPRNNKITGTSWRETRGKFDSYVMGNFTAEYDPSANIIKAVTNGVQENLEVVLPPYDGQAYYFKITLPSQRNRVVYKIYGTSSLCLHAARLLFKTCYDDCDDHCGSCGKGYRDDAVSRSKPRKELGCRLMQFVRYPQAAPFPLCADYRSCT